MMREEWPVVSQIRTEDGDLLRESSYLVRMQKNKDQKNSKQRNFLRSEKPHQRYLIGF